MRAAVKSCRIFAVASPSVDADVDAHINHSGVLLEPGQHSGAARLAGRTCASIVVRLNAAALKAIVSPVIHRIRSTRLVSRRPIHDRTPRIAYPEPESLARLSPGGRWNVGVRGQLPVLFIGCGHGRVRVVAGDADCGRLPWWRGDGPVVRPGRRTPGLLVCLVTGDTGRVSPRPPVHRSPIAWDRAGASCGTRSAARSNRRGSE